MRVVSKQTKFLKVQGSSQSLACVLCPGSSGHFGFHIGKIIPVGPKRFTVSSAGFLAPRAGCFPFLVVCLFPHVWFESITIRTLSEGWRCRASPTPSVSEAFDSNRAKVGLREERRRIGTEDCTRLMTDFILEVKLGGGASWNDGIPISPFFTRCRHCSK